MILNFRFADLATIQTRFPMLRGHETVLLRHRGGCLQVVGAPRPCINLQNGGGPGNRRGRAVCRAECGGSRG